MKQIKIGIITDLQYADSDMWFNRYFRNSINKLDQIIQQFNTTDLDFIVNLGDTVDQKFENFSAITKKLKEFKAPLINLAGNHDFIVNDNERKEVYLQLDIEKRYHHFDNHGFRFCFLDGNEISTFANEEGSPNYLKALEEIEYLKIHGELNGNDWNGGISDDQLIWFSDRLRQAQDLGLKVIAFCHYPVFPQEKHSLLNHREVLKLISEFPCLKAWLCGHNHEGNYEIFNRCHVVNFKGIVDYEFENTFSILTVSKNEIIINSYGREIERVLKI